MRVTREGVLHGVRRKLRRAQVILRPLGPIGFDPFQRRLPAKADGGEYIVLPTMAPASPGTLVALVLSIDRIDSGRYLYSKLYFATRPDESFSETKVVCFEVRHLGREQRLQIALPRGTMVEATQTGFLRLRVDGLPYAKGRWRLLQADLAQEDSDPALAREATRRAHRQWVREQVLESEAERRVSLAHYPESLSLELTAACNLRCPHCSSHGSPEVHQHHNQRREMSVDLLRRIGGEAFAHASVVSLVGRGEPTRASDELWNSLVELLKEHDIRISCVTNGTRLHGRLDATLMPWIHEVTFSIDGGTAATFEANRRGARFAAVMDNLRAFHQLRARSGLARRPQLTISWTLKRSNLEELPAFVEMIAPLEPDLLSIRHMVIFRGKDEEQSLLGDREWTNRHLRAAYERLDRLGLRHESPPLMLEPSAVRDAPAGTPYSGIQDQVHAEREPVCNWMHRTAIIMSDGEVTTCGKHYGAQVGRLVAGTRLWDVWNGPAMRSLRAGFGTRAMWDQCQHCWLREIKWHSQRQAKDAEHAFELSAGMDFSQSAWDYRKYSEL